MKSSRIVTCFLAGAFAAFSSVFGKVGGGAELEWLAVPWVPKESIPVVLITLRALCYGGVVACNIAMWSLYVRSLQSLPSLHATVLNTSANLLCSGFFGFLLFHEALRLQWVLGVFSILCGLLLLTKGAVVDEEKVKDA